MGEAKKLVFKLLDLLSNVLVGLQLFRLVKVTEGLL